MAGAKQRIVVLGGGPAGLAAGWKLAEQGHEILVLERHKLVGGQSKTVQRGDFRFDLGGHRFFTKYDDVMQEVEDLVGDDLQTANRRSVIRLNNQWINYPLEMGDLLRHLSPTVTARAAMDFFAKSIRSHLQGSDDHSFEDWVVNRFGRTLYDIYFGPYTEKLWGVPPSQIAADWASQRISLINLWDVFLRLVDLKKSATRTYLTKFVYPRWGIGTIAEKMAQRIIDKGGRILNDARITALPVENGHINEVRFEQDNHPQHVTCDHVVSTIPLPDLVQALGLRAKIEQMDRVQALHFRSLRFLNLALNFPRVSDNTWIYVPEKRYVFFRVQEPRNWSRCLTPEGKTSLILELACNRGDDLWHEPDDKLLDICLPQLVELGLLHPNQQRSIADCFSTYMTHAYPIYDLSYKSKIATALELCDGVDNLVTLGRQGLFRYNNMDQSLKMGFLAARHWGDPRIASRIRVVASEQEAFEDIEDIEDTTLRIPHERTKIPVIR